MKIDEFIRVRNGSRTINDVKLIISNALLGLCSLFVLPNFFSKYLLVSNFLLGILHKY